MNSDVLRAWRWHRQGLDGSLRGAAPADILSRTGWARSVGGAGPYLGLFARGRCGRAAIDEAVARLDIHELPAARGCTYVLPAADYALGLRAGAGFQSDLKTALRLGVTEREIDRLCAGVLAALDGGPLDPEQIRAAVGDLARNLGPEGAKKGVGTTLPVALGRLQAEGEIRRVPVNGRLDQQRYRYARWSPSPLRGADRSAEETATELARRYFRWIGPAALAELRWFSALGARAAKTAIEPLGLVPFESGSELLMFPDDLASLRRFRPPSKPQIALVSSLDGITLLRRDLAGLLDEEDRAREVAADGVRAPLGSLPDPPHHLILDRGRVVGLWEYDPDAGEIVWASFVPADRALRAAVEETEAFVRDELGDARSFSLDSPKSRTPRIAALRAVALRRE
jgi:hypothetical protein